MRIISKFQDYYDGVGQYSPEPVWVRKEEKLPLDKLNEYGIDKNTIDKLHEAHRRVPEPQTRYIHTSKSIIVGFCGYLHVVYIKSDYLGRPQDIVSASTPSSFVEKWNNNCEDKRDHISIGDDTRHFWFSSPFTDKGLGQWRDKHGFGVSDIHRSIKSPIFMIDGDVNDRKITINPSLKSIGFQVVVNPWDTYQELERFISNDMIDCPLDDFEMSDELKRDSKGMDEWSFKQVGPKKRKRKKS